jgi:hypothetical protein
MEVLVMVVELYLVHQLLKDLLEELVLAAAEFVQMLQIAIRIYLATEVVTHFLLEVLVTGMELAAAQEPLLTELPDKILVVKVELVDLVVLV